MSARTMQMFLVCVPYALVHSPVTCTSFVMIYCIQHAKACPLVYSSIASRHKLNLFILYICVILYNLLPIVSALHSITISNSSSLETDQLHLWLSAGCYH